MSRFVRPESVRLELPDGSGDWILVKKRLTAGEERRATARIFKASPVGQPMQLDYEQTGIAKIVAYLLEWSLTDDTGAVVPIRDQPAEVVEAAVLGLDPLSFKDVHNLIAAHETAQFAELEAEKKNPRYVDGILEDLYVCRIMGWTYWDLMDLPLEVYEVLIDQIRTETARAADARDAA